MNPIDTSQLNNSSHKTWDWSITYGIDQLNSPIDQSLVLMVTMKQMASGEGDTEIVGGGDGTTSEELGRKEGIEKGKKELEEVKVEGKEEGSLNPHLLILSSSWADGAWFDPITRGRDFPPNRIQVLKRE
jgi:hypothetical protein